MNDPHPPTETGRELTGPDAFAAMHDALVAMSDPARLAFTNVRDIEVRKSGRWVVVTVKCKNQTHNEVTVRINRAWAQVLRQRLNRVLP